MWLAANLMDSDQSAMRQLQWCWGLENLQRKNYAFNGSSHKSWVVPAGVFSALADILGAEVGQLIEFIIDRGGYYVIKSSFFGGKYVKHHF